MCKMSCKIFISFVCWSKKICYYKQNSKVHLFQQKKSKRGKNHSIAWKCFIIELSQIVYSALKWDNIPLKNCAYWKFSKFDPGMACWPITSHSLIYDLTGRTWSKSLAVKCRQLLWLTQSPQTTTIHLLSGLATILDHSNKTKKFLVES